MNGINYIKYTKWTTVPVYITNLKFHHRGIEDIIGSFLDTSYSPDVYESYNETILIHVYSADLVYQNELVRRMIRAAR